MVANSKPVFMQFREKIFKLSDRQVHTPTRGSSIKGQKVNQFPIILSKFHLDLCKASHLIATKSGLLGVVILNFLRYFACVIHTSSLNSYENGKSSPLTSFAYPLQVVASYKSEIATTF